MISDSDFLRSFLADRDVPCPLCGYNLRSLVGDRCPECGDQLVLGVNALEPKQAAAITGLILLSAGVGMNALLLIFGAVMIATRRGGGPDRFFFVNGMGLIVEGIAMGIWLKQWNTIRALGALPRWLLAICFCGCLTLVDLIAFISFIR